MDTIVFSYDQQYKVRVYKHSSALYVASKMAKACSLAYLNDDSDVCFKISDHKITITMDD